jgi:UPF0716 protein FxsA
MALVLFLLFTLVPLVELALLIWIGVYTVWWLPIALVILTGLAGAALARQQGWQTGARVRGELRSGRIPAEAMIDGLLIVVAAVLLIAPGVLTDVVGLALLLPPVRRVMKRSLILWLRRQIELKTVQFRTTIRPDDLDQSTSPKRHDEIIEAKVITSRVEEVK